VALADLLTPADGPIRATDLDTLPETSAYRIEVVDGMLVVNAAPGWTQQRVMSRLLRILTDAAPADFDVLAGPLDFDLDEYTRVQPDLVVVDRDQLVHGELRVRRLPVLAVEVAWPSTRRYDNAVKAPAYKKAGVPLWLVELDNDETSPEVVEFGKPAQRAAVFKTDKPFAVEFRPGDLVL
jgi:Uma2 family endonuclease